LDDEDIYVAAVNFNNRRGVRFIIKPWERCRGAKCLFCETEAPNTEFYNIELCMVCLNGFKEPGRLRQELLNAVKIQKLLIHIATNKRIRNGQVTLPPDTLVRIRDMKRLDRHIEI